MNQPARLAVPAPTVSVIVPAYNAEATLPACLAAIGRMTYPVLEVIVFSDGATDSTPKIAEASGAQVIHNTGPSRGPGHGRNVASRAARGDLLLFVDADVVIHPECLATLVAELHEHGATAAFGSYDNRPASTRVAGLYANLRHHFVHQNSIREASTFWSGVGLIERQVFLDLGGYDEEMFAHPSIEDVELGMRLKADGHRIRLVPEALAKHCKDWTLWRVWHTDVVRRALPWSRLLLQGKSEGADLNLSSAERIKALASVGTFASLIAGLFDARALLAALGLFALYLFLNRRFVAVLARNLPTSQWLRATLLHLCYHTYSLGAYLWVVAGHVLATAFGPPRADRADDPVRFDAPFLLCVAVLTALFSWALILNGKPAYFDDTAAYLSGGEKIFDRVFALLGAGASVAGDGAGGNAGPAAIRSLPYYVLTYVLSAPGRSLYLLALFQALVAAFYVVVHCRVERLGAGQVIAVGAVLSVFTPIALVAAFALPDIFAVPIIGGIALLATRFGHLSPAMRVALVLLAGLGLSMHISFIPLALAMTVLAGLWLAWTHRAAIAAAFPAILLASLPLVLGAAVTMAGSLVGFGEASVAPKRLPLVLARSIADGPGRWYLEEACPTERYAICEVFPDGDFPRDPQPILFREGGIMRLATAQQLDRIRAEEPEIVLRALAAYPGAQLQASLNAIGRQFVTFRPDEINFAREFYTAADGTLRTSRAPREPLWAIRAVDALAHVAIALAALLLLVALPRMGRDKLPVVLLCLLGIAANVAICAVFSAVAGRYGIRVLWLVPLLAALYAWAPVRENLTNLLHRSQRDDGAARAGRPAERAAEHQAEHI